MPSVGHGRVCRHGATSENHFEALPKLQESDGRFGWVRSDSAARSRAFQAKVNGVHVRSLLLDRN